MVRRLALGFVLGAIVGALAAAAFVFGLKMLTFAVAGGELVAYGAAVATGALTGIVAGKPIWAKGAKTEAGLKAFFGALLAAAAMFALRRWGGGWVVDLTAIGAGGPAAAPELPAAALPAIGAVLGALFELDNTDDPKSPVKTGDERVRVGAPSRRRVESAARPRDGEVRDEADEPAKNPAKRSTR